MHLLTAGNVDFHAYDDLTRLAVKHHLDVGAQQQHGLSTQGFEVGRLGQHLAQLLYAGIEEVDVGVIQHQAHHFLAVDTSGLGDGYTILEVLLLFVHGLALSEGSELETVVAVFADDTCLSLKYVDSCQAS